jgi:hypothetical protein
MVGFDCSSVSHKVIEEVLVTEGSPHIYENNCHTEYVLTHVFYGHPPRTLESGQQTVCGPAVSNCMMHWQYCMQSLFIIMAQVLNNFLTTYNIR